MKDLTRSVLIAALSMGLITVLSGGVAWYFLSHYDMDVLGRATVVANDPTASIQALRSSMAQLEQIAHGFIKIASGAVICAICIGALSTLLLFSVYVKLTCSASEKVPGSN